MCNARVVAELPGTRTFILPREPEGVWDVEKLERKKTADESSCSITHCIPKV